MDPHPIGYGKTMFHPFCNRGFHTDPDPGMDGRRIYWPRRLGLGGSSSINGLMHVHGQPDDNDRLLTMPGGSSARACAAE